MNFQKPKLIFVGTIDVDSRIELMKRLSARFTPSALGSNVELNAAFARAGFEYHTYSLTRRVSPLADLRSYFQLLAMFRRLRPDIVHTFDPKPSVWARLAARRAGVPVVLGTLTGLGTLYVNDDLTTVAIRRFYERLQRVASRASDATVFQNTDDAVMYQRAGIVRRGDVMVIPGSGVDTDRFSQAHMPIDIRSTTRSSLSIDRGAKVVTMVTRVCRSKGVLEFADAARSARERLRDLHFLLVGPEDRDARDRLSHAEVRELRKSVNWVGQRPDVPELYAASDIFAFSSRREGMPRAMLEASSMSLPIVTTDTPGCREVVQPGVNGLLVPLGDARAMADAVVTLAADESMRQSFGTRARQRAVNEFDISVVAKKTEALYTKLQLKARAVKMARMVRGGKLDTDASRNQKDMRRTHA
jgi:glycosyltransferase involved in cell wall biosynthesis